MEERTIKVSLNKAIEWYTKGGPLRELALSVYSEREIKYNSILNALFNDIFNGLKYDMSNFSNELDHDILYRAKLLLFISQASRMLNHKYSCTKHSQDLSFIEKYFITNIIPFNDCKSSDAFKEHIELKPTMLANHEFSDDLIVFYSTHITVCYPEISYFIKLEDLKMVLEFLHYNKGVNLMLLKTKRC